MFWMSFIRQMSGRVRAFLLPFIFIKGRFRAATQANFNAILTETLAAVLSAS